jgi:O-antigen/teichoic acid export membrane protein
MSLFINFLTTLSARIIVIAIAVASSIVLARSLGPEGRGLFALVLLLPDLAKSFGLLGFEMANAVYAGLEPERRHLLVWQSALIAAVAGATIVICGIVYLSSGSPGLPSLGNVPLNLAWLALLAIPGALLAAFWGSILRGMNLIIVLNSVEVGSRITSLVLLLVFLFWFRLGVLGAVLAEFLVGLALPVILGILLGRAGVFGKPQFDWSLLKRTAGFAIPAYWGNLLTYLNYRIDQFFVAAWLPVEQLAYYAIAVGIAERLWIITGAVGNVLLPHLANSKERDPSVSAAVARHVALWTGVACLALFVLADVLIRLMYSSDFTETVAPLRWLLPGILLGTIGKVVVAELLARERIGWIVWISGIATVVNIIGNIVLMPRMGISGAAFASTLSYSVMSVAVAYFYVIETHVPWTLLLPRPSDLKAYRKLWSKYRAERDDAAVIARPVKP